MSAEETVIQQPAVETPAAEPAAAPAAPEKPLERREIIEQAFKNPIPRDQRGKFTSPAAAPQFPTPPPARPPVPNSLGPKYQKYWEAAPVELAQRIVERETEMERGVEPLKLKAREADELLAEFRPYEMLLKMEGATPKQAIGPLLQTAAILRTGSPAQKAFAVAQTMRQFGIDIAAVHQLLNGNNGGPPQQPAQDPQVSQLFQQVQQLTQSQQQQNEARAMAAIKEFAANHKYFDEVTDDMQDLIVNSAKFRTQAEGMSEGEKLRLAYDTAVRMNPEIHQKWLADQRAMQGAAEQVTRARNAAVQVSGAPSAGPAPKVNPQDRRAVIAQAFARQR